MPTPSEAVRAAQAALGALVEELEVITELAASRAGANAALEATTKEHELIKGDLKLARAELDKVSAQLANKTSLIDDQRTQALARVVERIASAKDELAELEAQLKAKRQAHDSILAGMGSLVARLDLKRAG